MRILALFAASTVLASGTAFAETGENSTASAADAATAVDNTEGGESDPDQTGGVDDIVVTAQRREQNVQSVPIAITAISGDRLQGNAILTANDVARLVPSLTGANGGGRVARPRYFLRGVGVNDPSGNVVSPVGIYVDDVYLGDTAYQTFPLFDLERVEVLRGPQGTLWGKNTIGGAINYISRRPGFEPEGHARLEYGSYDSWAVQGAYGGAVIPDLLAARLSVNYEDRGGYYRNLYTGEEEGSVRDAALRLQFLLTPTPDLDILLNLHGRDLEDGGAPGYKLGTGPGGADVWGYVQTYGSRPELRDPVNLDAPSPPNRLDSRGANLNIRYRLGGLTLTSITSYDEIEREALGDGDGTPLPAQVSHSQVRSDQFTQELRLASDPEDRLSWTIGGHYFRENFRSDNATGTLAAVPAAPGFSAIRTAYQNTVLDQDTESFAAFAEATYRFTDRLRLSVGGRWTREEKSILIDGVQAPTGSTSFNNTGQWWLRRSLNSALTRNAVQDEDRAWSRFTYSISPQFDFTDNLRGYVRVASGFRSGGFNGNVTSQVAVNVVQPETLTDYEVGLKSEWFDNRLTVNVSAFIYDYKNIQVNVQGSLNGQSATTLRNAANGRISGVELEILARPTSRLTIRANGGWLIEAEYTDFLTQVLVNNVPTIVDASGNQIARAPRLTGTLDAEYALPLTDGHELLIGADVNYRSHIYFNAVAQTDPLQEQDAYALVNARLAWRADNGRWTLGAYVQNLTNHRYVHNNNVPRNGAYSLSLGPPRSWGVTVSTRF
jgi:iron complex outermembrane receptor protein